MAGSTLGSGSGGAGLGSGIGSGITSTAGVVELVMTSSVVVPTGSEGSGADPCDGGGVGTGGAEGSEPVEPDEV